MAKKMAHQIHAAAGAFELTDEAPIFVAQSQSIALTTRLFFISQNENLRKCRKPDCDVTPYFIANHGKIQFCCDLCARWGQRYAKRKYWQDTGSANRASRSNALQKT
jgi:hypothetical protein